ncbi:hypothetical protein K1T71_006776 [Dendrolimus kikuchii]|uniref:Uncharacterized protein n=1 Tax=Dendrolimus kikuchii TaxID=765133 RepID=A0ACC1D1Y9_9NEOP|nr:hypothetical protein K1T71_006776 [Dendrolimus kikuchii]
MSGKITAAFVVITMLALFSNFGYVSSNPAIAMGYDPLDICIENCAQCKKMLGAWFEGPLCAESCIKNRGKMMPECENFASISPFLNKLY